MKTFPLHIGTPDGLLFEGNVEKVICRTITGDLAILSGHSNFCTALGMGESTVVMEDGSRRAAACIGGMLSVHDGEVRLVASTFEWQEDIDRERAKRAEADARNILGDGANHSAEELAMAEAKLRRALIRQGVAGR